MAAAAVPLEKNADHLGHSGGDVAKQMTGRMYFTPTKIADSSVVSSAGDTTTTVPTTSARKRKSQQFGSAHGLAASVTNTYKPPHNLITTHKACWNLIRWLVQGTNLIHAHTTLLSAATWQPCLLLLKHYASTVIPPPPPPPSSSSSTTTTARLTTTSTTAQGSTAISGEGFAFMLMKCHELTPKLHCSRPILMYWWNHFKKSKFDDTTPGDSSSSSGTRTQSGRHHIEGAGVLRGLPVFKNELPVHIYIRVLCAQLQHASLDEIQKTLVSIGLNLPASARIINTAPHISVPLVTLVAMAASQATPTTVPPFQAARPTVLTGLCTTHASLRNTGDVLLAIGVGCAFRSDTTPQEPSPDVHQEKEKRKDILVKVSTFLVRRLDFANSDSAARDVHMDQLFTLVGICQHTEITLDALLDEIARCMGELASEYNALLGVTGNRTSSGNVISEKQLKDIKRQSQHVHDSVSLCLDHIKNLWQYPRNNSAAAVVNDDPHSPHAMMVCGTYRLIGSSKTTGLAAIINMRVSSTDYLHKEAMSLLTHVFEAVAIYIHKEPSEGNIHNGESSGYNNEVVLVSAAAKATSSHQNMPSGPTRAVSVANGEEGMSHFDMLCTCSATVLSILLPLISLHAYTHTHAHTRIMALALLPFTTLYSISFTRSTTLTVVSGQTSLNTASLFLFMQEDWMKKKTTKTRRCFWIISI